MARTHTTIKLIEFKGTTLPVVAVTLHSLQADALAEAASTLFGADPFFDGDAALLDLSQIGDAPKADWRLVQEVFKTHGLNVFGVRGGSEELRRSAAAAGLPAYAAVARSPQVLAAEEMASPPPPASEAPVAAPPPRVRTGPRVSPTIFVDRPLRSGQQVYARGGDLVMLAIVNAGAEVIADGSIHIYAPLRGRALAGASGAEDARILCTSFAAELVSVAGLYRTFDAGLPAELAGKAVHVRLTEKAGDDPERLIIEVLRNN